MQRRLITRLWTAFHLAFWLSLFSFAVTANELTLASNPDQAIPLGPYYQVYNDPQHDLTIDTLLSDQNTVAFVPLANNNVNLGYKSETYWFKVNVINTTSKALQQLIEFDYPLLDELSFYVVNKSKRKLVTSYDAGDNRPFFQRHYQYPNFVFPITLPANSATELYIRIRTDGSMTAGASLYNQANFLHKSRFQNFYITLYLGVLIALILYNLLLFISIRKIRFLYLVLFGSSTLLATGSLNVVWFELLWPNLPNWHNVSIPFGFALTGLFASAFSRSFLKTATEAIRCDLIFRILIIVFALLALASSYFSLYFVSPIISLFAIVLAITSISTATALTIKGDRYAQIYLFAWLSLMLGISIFAARNLGWLPNTFYTLYSIEFGSALGLLMLSLALAERIKFFQRESEKSRQEVYQSHIKLIDVLRHNERELNQRVHQRTLDLAQANEKLQEKEEALKKIAHYDPLTGLANRFLITEELNLLLAHCKREQSRLAVLFLDLDGFKGINDQYGHKAGDDLLVATADKLRYVLRDSDVIGRIGGDEFIVLLEESDGDINPQEVADKIKTAILQPVSINGVTAEISVSIGIAIFPDTASNIDALINIADQEMYLDKQNKSEPFIAAND